MRIAHKLLLTPPPLLLCNMDMRDSKMAVFKFNIKIAFFYVTARWLFSYVTSKWYM